MNYRIAILDSMTKLPKWNLLPVTGQWRYDIDSLLDEVEVKSKKVELVSAKNEYESFQLVILCKEVPLEDVQIKISDMKSAEGYKISSSCITVRLVGYVKTVSSWYKTDYHGWWPDPLFDYSEPLNVLPYNKVHLWFTIYVPEDTPAGEYEGSISFIPINSSPYHVFVHLKVWNFALPSQTHFPFLINLRLDFLEKFYNLSSLPINFVNRYADILFKYRLMPHVEPKDDFLAKIAFLEENGSFSFDFSPIEQYIQLTIEKGHFFNLALNFCLYNRFTNFRVTDRRTGQELNIKYKLLSPEYSKILIHYLKAAMRWVEEKGWKDKAFLGVWDEPAISQFSEFKRISALVKEAVPDIPRFVAIGDRMQEAIADAVDIWCPLSHDYEKKVNFVEKERKKGKKVWWYVCASSNADYCNFFIDMAAIKHRILFWQSWKYKVDGMLYWSSNYWGDNVPSSTTVPPQRVEEELWPFCLWKSGAYSYNGFDLNGDGYLLYPGLGGKPLGSLRLEIIRDGLEDYEYLWLLSRRLEEKKGGLDKETIHEIKKILSIESITKTLTNYTLAPDRLLSERKRVAEMIERLG